MRRPRGIGAARPHVGIELGPTIPAWMLRVTIVATATGCAALVATHSAHWVLAAALVVTMIVWPGTGAGVAFAVGAGLLLLVDEPDPLNLRVVALVVGLHLTLQLAAITAGLPWTAAVERSVLTASLPAFLAVQVFTQLSAAAGAWASGHRPDWRWLPVVAGVALAALTWAVLVRLRPQR